MIRLRVLSGGLAGDETEARHFPFRVGRAPGADLRLEDPGVWEAHLELQRQPLAGFFSQREPGGVDAREWQARAGNGPVV